MAGNLPVHFSPPFQNNLYVAISVLNTFAPSPFHLTSCKQQTSTLLSLNIPTTSKLFPLKVPTFRDATLNFPSFLILWVALNPLVGNSLVTLRATPAPVSDANPALLIFGPAPFTSFALLIICVCMKNSWSKIFTPHALADATTVIGDSWVVLAFPFPRVNMQGNMWASSTSCPGPGG